MEISDIKTHLKLSQVLDHYGLKPDKNQRLHCPWHDDKTPSLQLYPKTNTWTCFSSNCSAGSGDQIEFCVKMEKDKHKGILVAKSLVNGTGINEPSQPGKTAMPETGRHAVLTKLFGYFKNGVSSSNPAKDYLESRGLDFTKTEVGYNSGQFHQGMPWLINTGTVRNQWPDRGTHRGSEPVKGSERDYLFPQWRRTGQGSGEEIRLTVL
jgi:DNA primase